LNKIIQNFQVFKLIDWVLTQNDSLAHSQNYTHTIEELAIISIWQRKSFYFCATNRFFVSSVWFLMRKVCLLCFNYLQSEICLWCLLFFYSTQKSRSSSGGLATGTIENLHISFKLFFVCFCAVLFRNIRASLINFNWF
jgi:hypothetical protein